MYVGKIREIHYGLDKQSGKQVASVLVDTSKGQIRINLNASTPRTAIGQFLFWDIFKNEYTYRATKPNDEEIDEGNRVIGKIAKYSPTYTDFFEVDLFKPMESLVGELSFISLKHEDKDFLCQITKLIRHTPKLNQTESGTITALVNVLSSLPKNPFIHGTYVMKSTRAQIEKYMCPEGDGILTIGKLYGAQEDIPVRITSFGIENGINIFGAKNFGKSYLACMLLEEACRSGKYAALSIDIFGESIFKFPNPNALNLSVYGFKPKGLNNPIISFDTKANPFTDAKLEKDISILYQDNFWKTMLIPNQITSLSIKGLAPEVQAQVVAICATKLRELGLKFEIPPTFVMFDEVHEFARQGKHSVSSTPLIDLNTNSAHAQITCLNLTQRQASLDKNILAHATGWITLRLVEENDIESLPGNIRKYKHLLNTLPQGAAVISGITPFTTLVQTRERLTRSFRGSKSVQKFFEEDCKGIYNINPELQTALDNIEILQPLPKWLKSKKHSKVEENEGEDDENVTIN